MWVYGSPSSVLPETVVRYFIDAVIIPRAARYSAIGFFRHASKSPFFTKTSSKQIKSDLCWEGKNLGKQKRYLSHANLFLVVFLDLQIQKTGSQVLLHVKCLQYSVVRALYAPTMYARVASWQIWHVNDHIQNRAF